MKPVYLETALFERIFREIRVQRVEPSEYANFPENSRKISMSFSETYQKSYQLSMPVPLLSSGQANLYTATKYMLHNYKSQGLFTHTEHPVCKVGRTSRSGPGKFQMCGNKLHLRSSVKRK